MEIVLTAHAVCRLPHILDGGDQQANQDADDGDNHEKLDQCKTSATTRDTHKPCSGGYYIVQPYSYGILPAGCRQEKNVQIRDSLL